MILLTFAVCMKYDITEALSSKFGSLTISLVTQMVTCTNMTLLTNDIKTNLL